MCRFLPRRVSSEPDALHTIAHHSVRAGDYHLKLIYSCVPVNRNGEDCSFPVHGAHKLDGVLHGSVLSYWDGCVFVIDSLAVKLQTYSPPKRRDIKTIRYIIQPHNIDNQHWTVMIVHLDFSSGIQAFVYDPLIIDENIEILTATWHSFTLPFIKQWYNRDHETEASILDSKEEHAQATPRELFPIHRCQIIEQPVQDDFHSCGIFCIGMVDSVVNKTSDFRKRHSISATDLKALRLKILCATLSESVGRIEEEENITMRKVKVARITAELQKLKA